MILYRVEWMHLDTSILVCVREMLDTFFHKINTDVLGTADMEINN